MNDILFWKILATFTTMGLMVMWGWKLRGWYDGTWKDRIRR
ncbi:MAG TPA: hypothetical protein VK797_22930 [Tepidisphaeraceae bacterium]|nr:hypothetical protein [Tepidisphaeraceae bacterium]